jgi:hypothetical protein
VFFFYINKVQIQGINRIELSTKLIKNHGSKKDTSRIFNGTERRPYITSLADSSA